MTPASKSATFARDLEQTRRYLHNARTARSRRAPELQRPEYRVAEAEGLPRASAQTGAATSIDAWVADLMEKPEKKRAESLYELLLRLNLSVSHLEDVRETYARRLGLC